jgi:hypothetical protein
MARSLTVISLGLSIAIAMSAGCIADVGSETADENVASVMQREVVNSVDGSCPAPFDAQTATVKYDKELLITNTAVVDDPCRTVFNNPLCTDPNFSTINGKWSFWYLMSQMAGTPTNVPRFILKWLESFEANNVVVNGQTLEARTKIRNLIIDPWRQKSGCTTGVKVDDPGGACPTLNPTLAPFRLLAIVDRVDLRAGGAGSVDQYGNVSTGGDAGEGRFVFGFTNVPIDVNSVALATPLAEATMIFEYKVPTGNRIAKQWALDWRDLGNSTTFDATYKSKLQTITERFVKSGVTTGNPNNGNAISQVRSNERTFDPHTLNSQKVWSMREFKLNCLPGTSCGTNDKFIVNTTTAQTPPHDLINDPANARNETTELDDFLTDNQSDILAGKHVVPASINSVLFLAGDSRSPSFPNVIQWNRTDPNDYLDAQVCTARRLYAFSTCNGCHYLETDNTGNLHIKNRSTGNASVLSTFMTSNLPVTNDPCESSVTYDEPKRRKCELLALAAGTPNPVSTGAGRIH